LIIAPRGRPGNVRRVSTALTEEFRLVGLSAKAYEHPADRAATAALASVPMLDTVVRKLVEYGYERALRQAVLGNAVRLGERQLAGTYEQYVRARRTLDLPGDYALYVGSLGPFGMNAMTTGSKEPLIILGGDLVTTLDEDEQRVVIAHELGHILSDHVLYRTALIILTGMLAGPARLPLPINLPVRALVLVLLEWFRAAELSADRAAVLAVRDPQLTCRALMTISAGIPSKQLDLDAFLTQAKDYADWTDPHDRTRRFFLEIGRGHPIAVRRVAEIMRWVQEGDYDRIVGGDYVRRGHEPPARESASDAVEFYTERFKALFQEAGENISNLGKQVTDWLRNLGSSRDGD
jgi:Zn-dependent protease with chaperone function